MSLAAAVFAVPAMINWLLSHPLLQSVRVQVSDVTATLQLLQSVCVQAGGADCSCFPTALTATDLTCQICNVS